MVKSVPSAVTEEEVSVDQTRNVNDSEGDEDELEALQHLPPDERRRALRRLRNRESARRVRARRLAEMNTMEGQVSGLQEENTTLKAHVAKLQSHIQAMTLKVYEVTAKYESAVGLVGQLRAELLQQPGRRPSAHMDVSQLAALLPSGWGYNMDMTGLAAGGVQLPQQPSLGAPMDGSSPAAGMMGAAGLHAAVGATAAHGLGRAPSSGTGAAASSKSGGESGGVVLSAGHAQLRGASASVELGAEQQQKQAALDEVCMLLQVHKKRHQAQKDYASRSEIGSSATGTMAVNNSAQLPAQPNPRPPTPHTGNTTPSPILDGAPGPVGGAAAAGMEAMRADSLAANNNPAGCGALGPVSMEGIAASGDGCTLLQQQQQQSMLRAYHSEMVTGQAVQIKAEQGQAEGQRHPMCQLNYSASMDAMGCGGISPFTEMHLESVQQQQQHQVQQQHMLQQLAPVQLPGHVQDASPTSHLAAAGSGSGAQPEPADQATARLSTFLFPGQAAADQQQQQQYAAQQQQAQTQTHLNASTSSAPLPRLSFDRSTQPYHPGHGAQLGQLAASGGSNQAQTHIGGPPAATAGALWACATSALQHTGSHSQTCLPLLPGPQQTGMDMGSAPMEDPSDGWRRLLLQQEQQRQQHQLAMGQGAGHAAGGMGLGGPQHVGVMGAAAQGPSAGYAVVGQHAFNQQNAQQLQAQQQRLSLLQQQRSDSCLMDRLNAAAQWGAQGRASSGTASVHANLHPSSVSMHGLPAPMRMSWSAAVSEGDAAGLKLGPMPGAGHIVGLLGCTGPAELRPEDIPEDMFMDVLDDPQDL